VHLKKYQNEETYVYLPGMFAGGWMWSLALKHTCNSDQFVFRESLCELNSDISGLVRIFCNKINEFDKPVTLVGNSLGSLIALFVAKELKDRVKCVVISGSAGFSEVKLDHLGFKFSRRDPAGSATKLASLILFDQRKIDSPFLDRLISTFESNMIQILRLMNESNQLVVAHKLLGDLECPIKAIWGKNDVITPLQSVERILGAYNVDTGVIDCCGHSPMFEKPKQFAETLTRLCERG
jgi:pimeloyl-ACP methyl ester carboxylesterase